MIESAENISFFLLYCFYLISGFFPGVLKSLLYLFFSRAIINGFPHMLPMDGLD